MRDYDSIQLGKTLTNYIRMWAQNVVTHAMFYDILVGEVVLYPLGVTIDILEETTYY